MLLGSNLGQWFSSLQLGRAAHSKGFEYPLLGNSWVDSCEALGKAEQSPESRPKDSF